MGEWDGVVLHMVEEIVGLEEDDLKIMATSGKVGHLQTISDNFMLIFWVRTA